MTPKQVIIEVSSVCNLRCKGCPINDREASGAFMQPKLYMDILDKVQACYPQPTVIPWMNGEPLMHPSYAALIIDGDKRGLKQYITTNGHHWNDRLFQYIMQPNGIYQIIFSLDGIHEHTATGARPGTSFDQVLENIHKFGRMKMKAGNHIDMAVKVCHRGQDYAEIEEYIDYWLNEYYIDYVCVGKMLDTINETPMRTAPCRYFDDMFLVIRHDGTIVPCAYHPSVVNDDVFQVGNIKDFKTIDEAYNSHVLDGMRLAQRCGEYPHPCDTCGIAYTGQGFEGQVTSRLTDKTYYYHNDYYNQFYSKTKKKRGASWRDV